MLKNSAEKGSVGPDGSRRSALQRAPPRALLVYCSVKDNRGLEPSVGFSPYRHSDGHHSSYLLRTIAQLRSHLWACLPRAPPAPGRSPSAWRWVGGALLGPVVLSKCPRLCLVARCEAEEAPPAGSRSCVIESRFNWKLFWQFLRPHLLVLGAAIVVRSSSTPPKPGTGRTQPGVCRIPSQSYIETA